MLWPRNKINWLRNYYGGENNKVEKPKTSDGDLDSVYVLKWKFFDSLCKTMIHH